MHYRIPLILILFLFAAASTAKAQSVPEQEALQAFQQFREQHGENWRVLWGEGTGRARFLYGFNIVPERKPKSDADFEKLAREFLDKNFALFGISTEQLVLKAVNRSELSKIESSDKVGVEFVQQIQDVEVYQASVIVLFLADGRLVAVDSQAIPVEGSPLMGIKVGENEAQQRAAEELQHEFDVLPDSQIQGRLVIYPWQNQGGKKQGRLSWMIEARSSGPNKKEKPAEIMYVLSADTDSVEVLAKWPLVHTVGDITGTLLGWGSAQFKPDTPDNPKTIFLMPNAQLSAPGLPNVNSNNDGYFVFPNVSASKTVTAKLIGPYAKVVDGGGANATVSDLFTPGYPKYMYFNVALDPNETAEINAFHWISEFRNYLNQNSSYNIMDFQVLANVNKDEIPGGYTACNATYNGSSINFLKALGFCVNTAYSTVIAHEEGHWANDKAGSGNGQDGFGEGSADVWALYVCNDRNGNTDDPLLGRDFYGPGTWIRTAENMTQFCGDGNPGCYGETHKDGEVLMGAFWKMRQRMKASQGAFFGNNVAKFLMISWYQQYNQTQIKSVIETQLLTLDDNDGNISNGTPHYCDIDGAFRDQGFPGVTANVLPVYVDASYSGVEKGTQSQPYNTIQEGLNAIISGSCFTATLSVKAGNYSASPTIPVQIYKAMQVVATNGEVKIGY